MIVYVGLSETNVQKRANKQYGQKPLSCNYIPDPKKLKMGIKEWVYKPLPGYNPDDTLWQTSPDYFAACWNSYLKSLRVFVAPMPNEQAYIPSTETALMNAVWKYGSTKMTF